MQMCGALCTPFCNICTTTNRYKQSNLAEQALTYIMGWLIYLIDITPAGPEHQNCEIQPWALLFALKPHLALLSACK
jgi:hypothetical protein